MMDSAMIMFGVQSELKQLLTEVAIGSRPILPLIAMNAITIKMVQNHLILNAANMDILVDSEKNVRVMLKDGVNIVV